MYGYLDIMDIQVDIQHEYLCWIFMSIHGYLLRYPILQLMQLDIHTFLWIFRVDILIDWMSIGYPHALLDIHIYLWISRVNILIEWVSAGQSVEDLCYDTRRELDLLKCERQ